jgi:hypothetical protein
MKRNARVDRSGLARLAAMNPVPSSERDSLVARLSEIRPQLPQRDTSATRTWWKPPIIALAVLVVLGVGGVAVAGSWDPLSAIGAADRPAEPTDTLSAAVIEQVRKNEGSWPPGWVSPIGSRLVDQARLLGELPDGHKVYAVPTSKGKLCILVAESGESCSDPLTRERPITLTISKVGPGSPHVIWGVTANDVVSVSFEVGGQPVTVPVENNFFAWEGQPTAKLAAVSPATVTFLDGTTGPAR